MHIELRTANVVFWVYLGQPGNASFFKRTQRNHIWLFVLLNKLDLKSESYKQCTLSSHLLIKMVPDIDGRFMVFRQKQNAFCISGHAVTNSSERVTAIQLFHASF